MNDIGFKKPLLPWDNFNNWFYSIIAVKFDLELGQAIELVYPQSIKLVEKEKMNICFLSFPDSNSACIGDTIYHFRLPIMLSHRKSSSLFNAFNKECLPMIRVYDNFYYGYVYFRQVKDPSYQRGYFQKSLLILTKYPFHNLFYYILQEIAPLYFKTGLPTLESASHDIDQWAPPIPGVILNLPFMGKIIKSLTQRVLPIHPPLTVSSLVTNGHVTTRPCRIPKSDDLLSNSHLLELYRNESLPSNENTFNTIFIPNLCEMDLYSCLLPIISQMHLLWELVLTCEPLLVIGSTPSICSTTVEALVRMFVTELSLEAPGHFLRNFDDYTSLINTLSSIIWPLRYASDYRPYFTIHDQDFKKFVQNDVIPPIILGVTNPFFAKSLQHWPHIIRVNPSTRKSHKHTKMIKKTSSLQPFDCKTGVYTKYKCYIKKDKAFLDKLVKGSQSQQRPTEVQNAMIRRYFTELTQSFMIPLERYIACLLPLFDDISPFKKWPELGIFNPDEFLKGIKQSGPQLTTHLKGDWEGLYRKFFKSPTFETWYNARMLEMSHKVAQILSQKIQKIDFTSLNKNKTEMEIVDVIIILREKLKQYRQLDVINFHTNISYIEQQIYKLTQTLPQDLRLSL